MNKLQSSYVLRSKFEKELFLPDCEFRTYQLQFAKELQFYDVNYFYEMDSNVIYPRIEPYTIIDGSIWLLVSYDNDAITLREPMLYEYQMIERCKFVIAI